MAGARKCKVALGKEERDHLDSPVYVKSSKEHGKRAHIPHLADEGEYAGKRFSDLEIAGVTGSHATTVERVRRRCVMEGLEAALERREQVNRKKPVLDGDAEAKLVFPCCGEPPEGYASWTLSLPADEMA